MPRPSSSILLRLRRSVFHHAIARARLSRLFVAPVSRVHVSLLVRDCRALARMHAAPCSPCPPNHKTIQQNFFAHPSFLLSYFLFYFFFRFALLQFSFFFFAERGVERCARHLRVSTGPIWPTGYSAPGSRSLVCDCSWHRREIKPAVSKQQEIDKKMKRSNKISYSDTSPSPASSCVGIRIRTRCRVGMRNPSLIRARLLIVVGMFSSPFILIHSTDRDPVIACVFSQRPNTRASIQVTQCSRGRHPLLLGLVGQHRRKGCAKVELSVALPCVIHASSDAEFDISDVHVAGCPAEGLWTSTRQQTTRSCTGRGHIDRVDFLYCIFCLLWPCAEPSPFFQC